MFDLGASELLLIVIVAVIVIGPKDLPLALRTAGRWIGRIRRLSGHFRAGLDAMVREAEMEEMEKKWKAQNEKIMRQDPATLPVETEPTGALPSPRAPAFDPKMPATQDSSPPPPVPAPASPEGAGRAEPSSSGEGASAETRGPSAGRRETAGAAPAGSDHAVPTPPDQRAD